MTDRFYEYFLTDKFDNNVILKDSEKEYTVKDVKNMFGKEISGNENLRCIVNFLESALEDTDYIPEFTTSGSTAGEAKCVKKPLKNLFIESRDIYDELDVTENFEVISTTTLNHFYGFCFHFVFPLCRGNIINLDRINYPEDIKIENAVLITTPSFLESLRKYDAKVEVKPKVIISAGSRLKNETFKYAEGIADRVIDLYGSTETGSIGYRDNCNSNMMKLFRGIKILKLEADGTEISTEYSEPAVQKIGDRLLLRGDRIEFLGRCDRVLKVQEKRINAEDIELELKKSDLIEDIYCLETGGKIGAMCVLTSRGQKSIIEKGSLEVIKYLKSLINGRFEVIPQRWKFVDRIPENQRGKVDIERIKEIFDLNLSFPLIISRICERDFAEYELCFLRGSNFFRGHFEGMPILAGVVQFFYVDFFIKDAFKLECRQGQIRRIKFSNIIRPDRVLRLRLNKTETGVNFKYEDDEKTYSSGIFPLKSYL